jgi:hypothetical protein
MPALRSRPLGHKLTSLIVWFTCAQKEEKAVGCAASASSIDDPTPTLVWRAYGSNGTDCYFIDGILKRQRSKSCKRNKRGRRCICLIQRALADGIEFAG